LKYGKTFYKINKLVLDRVSRISY